MHEVFGLNHVTYLIWSTYCYVFGLIAHDFLHLSTGQVDNNDTPGLYETLGKS
jgi:hypothetical protein